jgi:alpha-tubulin suppressor-like RCC1 family protein
MNGRHPWRILVIASLSIAVALAGCPTNDPDPGDIAGVAAGLGFTLVVKDDGSLWGFGANTYGQLGVATDAEWQNTPVRILDAGVATAAAGHHHTMILKTDGTLWACGQNDYGQLGDGTKNEPVAPVEVMSGVAAVSAAIGHTLILKEDGTLWACGWNQYYQLGDGTDVNKVTSIQVTGIPGTIVTIETGGWSSYAVTSDGKLYAWGMNHVGQLGLGDTTNRSAPTLVMTGVEAVSSGQAYAMIKKTDGSLWLCGENNEGQQCIALSTAASTTPHKVMDSGVASFSAGGWHPCVIATDGTVRTWGFGLHGQMGNGTIVEHNPDIVTVATLLGFEEATIVGGGYHTAVISAEGLLWLWGLDESGQLGDGRGDNTDVNVVSTIPQQLVIEE